MFQLFKRFKRSEKGQGMVEYGLILALVSIVALGALGGIGGKLNDTFEQVVGAVSGGEVIPEGEALYTDEEVQDLVDNQGYTKVATVDDLNNVRNNLSGKYIQVANIDLSDVDNFEPIGKTNNAYSFTGTFDGGGYEIKNLTVNTGDSNYAGLFGRTNGATLKNIGLVNVNVTGGSNTGGLVGYSNSSSVSNGYATGEVSGGSYTGGLVGYNGNSSTVTNSYATGEVSGGDYTGGLVGYQQSSSTTNSYATGEVSGGNYTGGLVGYNHYSSVTNSYYDTQTTKQETSDGGTGKTTAEMKKKDTYEGWNFESIWTIESNQYPTHR